MSASQGGNLVPEGGSGGRLKQFFVGRSLDACIGSGRDNVLQLRILAAVMVIFGHSFAILGGEVGAHEPLHYLIPRIVTHITGVNFFFTISGLLITLSWLRKPDLFRFLRARALRILPALAVCVAVTAFVIGPFVTTLPLHAYFVDGDAYGTPLRYFLGNATLQLRPFLPGVFEHVPVPRWVNGSLWTLPVEAIMYLCVAALGLLRVFRFPWLAIGYFVLWFCYVPRLPKMPGGIDLSYGTYLYAFPLQQILVMKGVADPLLLFAIATPIVLVIAALSWFFIEKPALRLKDVRWPWRGRRAQAAVEPTGSAEAA